MAEMKAIALHEYGGIGNLVPIKVPKPADPERYDVLVKYAVHEHLLQETEPLTTTATESRRRR